VSLGCRAVIAILVALPAGGCFSDRGPAGPEADVVECVLPVAAVRRGDRIVVVRGFAFVPDSVAVDRGQTVTWVNCEPAGSDAHTATAEDRAWGSPLLHRGDFYSRTFDDTGRFAYFCLPHAVMRGVVMVR
jgi:plastocyanin